LDAHIFICHASDDKDALARPLAEALRHAGVRVWFDEFSLQAGDSLRQSIDDGLARCSYGLVILSEAFFRKRWAQRELNGLIAREMAEGRTVVIPIWYEMSHAQIARESPLLADTLAFKYDGDLVRLVEQIVSRLRFDDPYRQIGGEHRVRLLHRNGSLAEWIIRREVQVGRTALASMLTRISTEGEITIKSVSPGVLGGFQNVSGTRMAVVTYEPRCEPGAVFTQEMIFGARNMYAESLNAANVMPTLPYESYTLAMETAHADAVTAVRAYETVGHAEIPLPGLVKSPDGRCYEIVINRPELRCLHTLLWQRVAGDEPTQPD
jgi:hypothetical protein